MDTHNFVIILHGPTGVGKTECADYLASVLPVELVNSDMGQLYTPLTIGTAKPDWRASTIPHHLFDILDVPELFSVKAYREKLKQILRTIWEQQKIPLIIGGSSYYVMSLFFPPTLIQASRLGKLRRTGPPVGADNEKREETSEYKDDEDVWSKLNEIDPERAEAIDPADTYRIARALEIWQSTGVKPSTYKPKYDSIADYYFIWITRDRDELYKRINERVLEMLDAGWIEEVKALCGTKWEPFLRKKKIIGYTEILDQLEGDIPYNKMVSLIQKRTRNYAKRQITFWRMLKEKLKNALKIANVKHKERCAVQEINLSGMSITEYARKIEQTISTFLND